MALPKKNPGQYFECKTTALNEKCKLCKEIILATNLMCCNKVNGAIVCHFCMVYLNRRYCAKVRGITEEILEKFEKGE